MELCMQVRGTALYNLLKLTQVDAASVKKWQVENYRELDESELVKRLHGHNIFLDSDTFPLFADNVESPEELLEYLVSTEYERESAEQIYLLFFELWRRHMTEKCSLSILCDQIDFLMSQYDQGGYSVAEELFGELSELIDLIDTSVNEEQNSDEVFAYISSFLAHDLERFVYDFCNALIDDTNEAAATDLVEGFEPYFTQRIWLEFLKLKVLFSSDSFDTDGLISRFGDELVEEKEIDLSLDFLKFLLKKGEESVFVSFFPKVLDFVVAQSHYKAIKSIASTYLDTLDEKHKHHKLLAKLIDQKKLELV